jgi:hypothetical protein
MTCPAACLYHLGNPTLRDLSKSGLFFAYELLSESSRNQLPPSFLEFASPYRHEAHVVLTEILGASPIRRILFTSDWQFGPEWTHRFGPLSLEAFWQLHDSRKLQLNAAYAIVA